MKSLSLKIYQRGQIPSDGVVKKMSKILSQSFLMECATSEEYEQEVKEHCHQNDYCFYLLKGNNVVSYLTVQIKNLPQQSGLKYAEIWNFCTNPHYRSQGYGTFLFQSIKSFLYKKFCSRLQFFQLMVLKKNKRAQQFYKRLGFIIVDKNDDLQAVTMISD
jgi:ribosomal protein S18 acetylase RimI-like enzyme